MYTRKGRVLAFVTGVISGGVLLFLALLVGSRLFPSGNELSCVERFGNLEVRPVGGSENPKAGVQGLGFFLDAQPFMYIHARNGKVSHLVAVNSGCPEARVLFSAETADSPGQWGRLRYPADVPHDGYMYEDWGLDGTFDVKTRYNEEGGRLAYIRLQGVWHEVDSVDYEKRCAHGDKGDYVFVSHAGWVRRDDTYPSGRESSDVSGSAGGLG